MKNLQLTSVSILLLITFQIASAQLNKGNILLGGTAGFDMELMDGSDNLYTLMLNPNVATLVTDNVAIGANLGLVSIKSGDYSTTVLNFLPLARYYHSSESGKTAFFLEAKAGLALISYDSWFGDDASTETAFQFAAGPGLAFFITENVSLDALLLYNRVTGDLDQSNLGFNLGFQIFLEKQKD